MDLNLLTPEQVASLKQQLGMPETDATGRSPLRPRQLHNLTLAPSATDPRPLFIWSAESPRDKGDLSRVSEFPKLLWHAETGKEITVHSRQEQDEKGIAYTHIPPTTTALDPVEVLAEDLAGLTDQERETVLAEQQKQRMKALQDRVANLSEAQLEALLAQATKPSKRIKKTA